MLGVTAHQGLYCEASAVALSQEVGSGAAEQLCVGFGDQTQLASCCRLPCAWRYRAAVRGQNSIQTCLPQLLAPVVSSSQFSTLLMESWLVRWKRGWCFSSAHPTAVCLGRTGMQGSHSSACRKCILVLSVCQAPSCLQWYWSILGGFVVSVSSNKWSKELW